MGEVCCNSDLLLKLIPLLSCLLRLFWTTMFYLRAKIIKLRYFHALFFCLFVYFDIYIFWIIIKPHWYTTWCRAPCRSMQCGVAEAEQSSPVDACPSISSKNQVPVLRPSPLGARLMHKQLPEEVALCYSVHVQGCSCNLCPCICEAAATVVLLLMNKLFTSTGEDICCPESCSTSLR